VEEEVVAKNQKLLGINGNRTVKDFHKELGKILWDYVGIHRDETGLKKALDMIPKLREEYWHNVKVTGDEKTLNKNLEMANRVADYFELAEVMARDALERTESCGCHLRAESQTPEGEALRKDDEYSYVSAWEWQGDNKAHKLHKEALDFENVELTQRSYK
jgi:succinate dehydrogenase / fumarate reductase flavoprotein subunit